MEDRIASQIHNELQCVSIGGTSHAFGVSRKVASSLLKQSVRANQTYTAYQVDATETKQEQVPCTVFKLVEKSVSGSELKESTAQLYALSLEEPLAAGHERDSAKLRDTDGSSTQTPLWGDILPSPEMEEAFRSVKEVEEHDSVEEETRITTTSTFSRTKKKATSATSFFANNKVSTKTEAKKNEAGATGKQDEKENNTVGNADDFVGDEEESEDEPDEQVTVPADKLRSKRVVMDDDDETPKPTRKPKSPIKSGAMDAFAVTKAPPQEAGAKRRRKVMKDKTMVDENGYLVTEKQEVWEDIPSDEDVPKPLPVKAKPTAGKKKVVKKQKSLAGFFAKK